MDNATVSPNNQPRVNWEIFAKFKMRGQVAVQVDASLPDTIPTDGEPVVQISRLPIRVPLYSYQVGVWHQGGFRPSIRPLVQVQPPDVTPRPSVFARLIGHAEAFTGKLRDEAEAAAEAARAKHQARGNFGNGSGIGAPSGIRAPGKTERKRSSTNPKNPTNVPGGGYNKNGKGKQ